MGANVNLGNIAPNEVIPLECLRLGLRGDTFFDNLPNHLIKSKVMTPEELKIKIASKSNIQIIDLREEYEYEDGSICKTNIPMGEVMTRLNEINNEVR